MIKLETLVDYQQLANKLGKKMMDLGNTTFTLEFLQCAIRMCGGNLNSDDFQKLSSTCNVMKEERKKEEKRKKKEEKKKREEEERKREEEEEERKKEEKRKRKEEKKKQKEAEAAAAAAAAVAAEAEKKEEEPETPSEKNYICMVCGSAMSESESFAHIITCSLPPDFRGERFIKIGGVQMDTTTKSKEKEEEEKEEDSEEERPGKKGLTRPKFALNSFVKNATMSISSSLAKLAKEEDDENPDFVCMICGRKLSAERTASHAKHCKAPSGYNGSQFMLLNSDEIKVEKPKEEAEPKSPKEESEPKKEAEEEAPHSPNPFDNPSESEEEEKKEEGEEKDEAPHSPNPFDNPSESEEEEVKKEAINVAAEVLPAAVHEEKEKEKEAAKTVDVSSNNIFLFK